MILAPGVNLIKLFWHKSTHTNVVKLVSLLLFDVPNKLVRVPGRPVKLSLMFVGKTRAYPSGTTFRRCLLG
jgi:hypothetical protein